MPGKPVPLRQRSYAIQPGVAWFSALPGGRAGGVPQPQRGCAEGPNVWVTLFRMGCDIENPSSRCPFRLIRARAGNLPAWCPGTTPLGLFILWEWTQGSASAAQPWALGQNPVGIPGGKIGQRLCTIPPPDSRPSTVSPPQRQRRCAIQPGVVRVAALPRGGAGGVPQPQRGCAVGTNVWVAPHRAG